MFHSFDFNFKWIPEEAENSVMEKISVLSGTMCINPGRMIMIHFFQKKRRSIWSRSYWEYHKASTRIKGGFSVYGTCLQSRGDVSAGFEGIRPCKSDISSICSFAAAVEGKNNHSKRHSVSFSDEIVVYYISYEDRKSQWMQMALDRYRFQRRIKELERLFCN